MCSAVNEAVGCPEDDANVALLLKLMYKNAIDNSKRKSPQGYRHGDTIKGFAASLFSLLGNSGYELIQANFGNALPNAATPRRLIYSKLRSGK